MCRNNIYNTAISLNTYRKVMFYKITSHNILSAIKLSIVRKYEVGFLFADKGIPYLHLSHKSLTAFEDISEELKY